MKTWRTKSGRALTEEDLDRMAEEVEHAEIDPEQFLENAWIAPKDVLARHLSDEGVQALEKFRRGREDDAGRVPPVPHEGGSRKDG